MEERVESRRIDIFYVGGWNGVSLEGTEKLQGPLWGLTHLSSKVLKYPVITAGVGMERDNEG